MILFKFQWSYTYTYDGPGKTNFNWIVSCIQMHILHDICNNVHIVHIYIYNNIIFLHLFYCYYHHSPVAHPRLSPSLNIKAGWTRKDWRILLNYTNAKINLFVNYFQWKCLYMYKHWTVVINKVSNVKLQCG